MLDRSKFHPYQNDMVDFIKDNPNAGVFADMGLGKTTVALTAANDLLDDLEVFRVLVIAPLRVAQHTWTDEIVQWAHLNQITTTILAGLTPAKRERAVFTDTQIHIINREQVVWLVELLGKNWHYDMLILDESHSFKSHTSKRFKALKKVRSKIYRMLELTGTPTNKSLMDLYAQLYLLDQGDRLGRTFTGFRNKYFNGDYMGYNWTLKPDAEKQIHQKISDICISLKASDYIDLPEKIFNEVKVDLPKKAYASYKELEKEFLLQIHDETITAVNAAVLTSKLAQAANGALYTGEGKQYVELHDAKLDALDEIIEGANGEPVLVVYNFKFDLDRILKRYPHARTISSGDDIIERWNNKEIPILLCHPASDSAGLNLQKGGHIMVWFSPTWNLGDFLQMVARLHRQGQKMPVIIHSIIANKTIDRSIVNSQLKKDISQQALLDAIKHDITEGHYD